MAFTDDEIEMHRMEATAFRGVFFDLRRKGFVAEATINGVRKGLGVFPTAAEAGAAYTKARAEHPVKPKAKRAGSFTDTFSLFLAKHGSKPPKGAEMVYDGQVFVYGGLTFRVKGSGKRAPRWAYHQWSSACLDCGEGYDVLTTAAGPKGITRRCAEHRKANPWADDAAKSRAKTKARKVAGAPAVSTADMKLSEVVDMVAAGLAAVRDEMPMAEFLQAVCSYASDRPGLLGMLPGLERIVRGGKPQELLVDGDVVVFGNDRD